MLSTRAARRAGKSLWTSAFRFFRVQPAIFGGSFNEGKLETAFRLGFRCADDSAGRQSGLIQKRGMDQVGKPLAHIDHILNVILLNELLTWQELPLT